MLEGIDVSYWQTTTPPLAGLSFLFARATYDVLPDGRYAEHVANARRAGLVVGAYHFGTGRSTPQAQAAAFLKAAGTVDYFALDLENDPVPMSQAQASAFIAAVKATGRPIYLYHSASGFPSLGQTGNWIAKWGTMAPASPWKFWQYQGTPLDRDRYDGTLVQLKAGGWKPVVTPPSGGVLVLAPGTAFYGHQGDTSPVGSFSSQYGLTVEKQQGGWTLGSFRAWVSNAQSGFASGSTGAVPIPAGTQFFAHRLDAAWVAQLSARYGFVVESENAGWTLGRVRAWVAI